MDGQTDTHCMTAKTALASHRVLKTDDNNNNNYYYSNTNANIYGAVIMAQPLREYARFI